MSAAYKNWDDFGADLLSYKIVTCATNWGSLAKEIQIQIKYMLWKNLQNNMVELLRFYYLNLHKLTRIHARALAHARLHMHCIVWFYPLLHMGILLVGQAS